MLGEAPGPTSKQAALAPSRSLRRVVLGLLGATSCLLAMSLTVPVVASAEPMCTDTWTGPAEGNWSTAEDWSTKLVPTSSDVACIGSGKTVKSEGTDQTGVVQGEGELILNGGSLEITNALERSVIRTFEQESSGTLKGAGTLAVSATLTWKTGTMSGSGSTVVESGASATIEGVELSGRSFVNEGTTTFSTGELVMSEGAQIKNSGTFQANSTTSFPAIKIGKGTPKIVNTGVFEKTSGASRTEIEPEFENTGTLSGGTAGISFGRAANKTLLKPSGVLQGKIEINGVAAVDEDVSGGTATIEINSGSLSVPAGNTVTLEGLLLTQSGTSVIGEGTLNVSGSLHWRDGTMSGKGTTNLLSSGTGTIEGGGELAHRTLVNEGTMTLGDNLTFIDGEGGNLTNLGTFKANTSHLEEYIPAMEGSGLIVNEGLFEKTANSGRTLIEVAFANYGLVRYETGTLELPFAIYLQSEFEWGGENPSRANPETPECGEGVSCATGNFSEAQTDFSVGGRGVGLDLTRTYNSQAAVAAAKVKKPGIFGYGWSASFSDHIEAEPEHKAARLIQSNGSQVVFAEGTGETFTPPAWSQDTLTGSKTAGYTLTLENQTVYKFAGATGRLESVTDRNGNATTLSYNEAGELTTITDPASRTIKLTYNVGGMVEKAEDPMKHVVKYTYEEENLKTVTQPAEEALRWQFKYDGSHQLTEITDGRSDTAVNKYNGSNDVEKQTDRQGRVTTFEYRPFLTTVKNETTGAVTATQLTSGDQANSITHGYGTSLATTETRTFDKAGDLLSLTDANKHTTKYAYDTHSNRTNTVDPNEHETKWTYNSTHDIETMTLPGGETTTYKRDSHGNPEVIERPAPGGKTQSISYKYDTHGQIESMTDPLKRVWKYEYDTAGDKTAEIDPEADKRTWGYDENSRETSMVSPRGHVKAGEEAKYTTKTERDAQERPIKTTDALLHETKYKYDGDGNLEVKTDPEGHETLYTYDKDNEQIKVKQPLATVETAYDGAGQVETQTDGNAHTTTYKRNVLEQVTEVVDPLKRKTTKEYDKVGNLTTVTDATKRVTTYKYDPANQVSELTYSDGKTPAAKYEYNSDRDRTKMTDGTGTATYGYDQLDRLTETKDGHGNTAGYEYDLANEQTKITYPNTKAVTREYDNAGRLKSVTDWAERTTKFSYDADSDLKATTFPAATTNEDTYAYDETDAMKEVKMLKGAEVLASVVYVRNKDGGVKNLTSKGLPGEEKPTYTYDGDVRLTAGAGVSYKYDAGNNPTTIGTEHTYSYDAADELEKSEVKKVPWATYSYDEVGERTKTTPASGAATTYAYDQAGDLTSVARPKAGETPAIEDSYGYNGDGLRTSQTISGTTTYLTWDLAEELPLIVSDGINSYIYGPNGVPVEQISSEGTALYLHHDQQASIRMLSGSTGVVAATTTYDAYGNVIGKGPGASTTALGYGGQYTDSDTGLIYLRARYYDPATGQFLSVDRLTPVTRQPYGYAEEDFVNQGDPSGLCPVATAAMDQGRRSSSRTEQRCKELLAKIEKQYKLAEKKRKALIEDKHKLPKRGKNMTIESHEKALQQILRGLKNLVEKFDAAGCNEYGFKVPYRARGLAQVPEPAPVAIPEPAPQGGSEGPSIEVPHTT